MILLLLLQHYIGGSFLSLHLKLGIGDDYAADEYGFDTKGYLPCVISPYIRNDYIQALKGVHAELEKFIRFIVEAELETEKDFIRALGLEMPELKNI